GGAGHRGRTRRGVGGGWKIGQEEKGRGVPAACASTHCTVTWVRWNATEIRETWTRRRRSRQNGSSSVSTWRRKRLSRGSSRTRRGHIHHPSTSARPPTTNVTTSTCGKWYCGATSNPIAPSAISNARPH